MNNNKAFGLIFSFFFLIIAFYFLFKTGSLNYYFLFFSLLFLIISFTFPKFLSPLKEGWIKFGEILGKFISPIVMMMVYFLIIFPTSLILRIFNKDILNIKKHSQINSYWIKKNNKNNNMSNQF